MGWTPYAEVHEPQIASMATYHCKVWAQAAKGAALQFKQGCVFCTLF